MAADFNSICESITIRFTCPSCGEEIISYPLHIPSPDFSEDSHAGSGVYEGCRVFCGKCGRSFLVNIYNAMYGGEVDVEGVDDVVVDEEFAEYINYKNYVFDLTQEKISSVIGEIENLSEGTKEFLYKQLYAGTITSMEAFLSSVLIKEVLSSEDNKRKFVENFKPLKDRKISYSDIYKEFESIDDVIKEALIGLTYHNLRKIKPIYNHVLNIDLGDIKEIMVAVRIRHDIVHRSGKDINGNPHNICKEDVLMLVEKVSSLMSLVNSKLNTESNAIDVDADMSFPWES